MEYINEVEVFKKVDYVTREVMGHYIVTKNKECYQIDEKTYKKILDNQTPDISKVLNM